MSSLYNNVRTTLDSQQITFTNAMGHTVEGTMYAWPVLFVGKDSIGNLLPVHLSASGAVSTSPAASASTTAATVTQGTKTVAASGTPERLAATTTLVESVILEGKNARGTNNTGSVWVGPQSADGAQLLEIAPGESIELKAPDGKKIDINLIYIDVATNADGITYTAIN